MYAYFFIAQKDIVLNGGLTATIYVCAAPTDNCKFVLFIIFIASILKRHTFKVQFRISLYLMKNIEEKEHDSRGGMTFISMNI